MAGNAAPIFSKAGIIGHTSVLNGITALATSNGAAATGVSALTGEMIVAATADVTNGSYIQRIRLRWVASAATTTTAVTVRLYISTVSSGATLSTNTKCFEEIVLGIQAAASVTIATFPYDIACNFVLPAGSTILASVGAKPAANTEIHITTYGGNY